MATLKIEPGTEGKLWVSLERFCNEDIARLKSIPGRRWHPEKKMWSVPNQPGMAERLSAWFAGAETTLEPSPRIAMRPSRGDAPLKDSAVAVSSILEKLGEELQLRGYSPRTRQVYQNQIKRFLRWAGQPPMALTEATSVTAEAVRAYLLYLAQEENASATSRNQARNAIKFLYAEVLREPEKVQDVPRAKEHRRLPAVLSREELTRLFAAVENLKH